ncbi:unnamed protein product [Amoebophrya sp. A120]|nr:unnamed protein product [Amoebophrya sp. A120]|eukprot:GSA120T00017951001.1
MEQEHLCIGHAAFMIELCTATESDLFCLHKEIPTPRKIVL